MNILVYVGIIWIQMQYMIILSNADNNFLDTLVFLARGLMWKKAFHLRKCIMRPEQRERQKESMRAAAFYFIWGDKVMTKLHILCTYLYNLEMRC